MKYKKTIIAMIFLALVGGGWYWHRKSSAPTYETTLVERGTVRKTVSANVSLVADTEIDLNFETTGRIKAIAVKKGDDVSEGEVIATLDSASVSEGVARAQAALEKARALAVASDDTLNEAREAAKDAKEYYEMVTRAEDQKVDAADKAYDNAVDYKNDAESYYNQVVSDDGASSATAKSAKLTFTTATNAAEAAREAKDTARKNRDVAARLARNSWSALKDRVTTLESSAQEKLHSSDIDAAEADYNVALATAEKMKIKAPVNGRVTKVNYDIGEVVGSSMTKAFGTLLSYDSVLEAKVSESDIASVSLGQKADVTFDALDPDEVFSATVAEIDPDSTVIQDVVYYIVRLRFDHTDTRFKPGMSGDADMRVAEKSSVLFIPRRLIREESGKKIVSVLSAVGTLEDKTIETGLEGDEGMVEIKTGLAEGDMLVRQGGN